MADSVCFTDVNVKCGVVVAEAGRPTHSELHRVAKKWPSQQNGFSSFSYTNIELKPVVVAESHS